MMSNYRLISKYKLREELSMFSSSNNWITMDTKLFERSPTMDEINSKRGNRVLGIYDQVQQLGISAKIITTQNGYSTISIEQNRLYMDIDSDNAMHSLSYAINNNNDYTYKLSVKQNNNTLKDSIIEETETCEASFSPSEASCSTSEASCSTSEASCSTSEASSSTCEASSSTCEASSSTCKMSFSISQTSSSTSEGFFSTNEASSSSSESEGEQFNETSPATHLQIKTHPDEQPLFDNVQCRVHHPDFTEDDEVIMHLSSTVAAEGCRKMAKHCVTIGRNGNEDKFKISGFTFSKRNELSLVEINGLSTKGMQSAQLLQHMLLISQDGQLEMVLKCKDSRRLVIISGILTCTLDKGSDKNIYGLTIQNLKKNRSHRRSNSDSDIIICDNGVCCPQIPIEGITIIENDISIDYEIEIAHTKTQEICYIEHPKTGLSLKVENGKLVTFPLQNLDQSMVFDRALYGGRVRHRSDGNGLIVFIFKETHPDGNAYISATGPNKVGLQILPQIGKYATALNSFDPRLFYHKYASTFRSCLESTCYEGYYLAINDDKGVYMKKVEKDDLAKDDEIQFVIQNAHEISSDAVQYESTV